jgi:PKHD-type hydroxylase
MFLTNEWYYFVNGIDKKTCNKIKRLASGKWENSKVEIGDTETTAEERVTGRKLSYGPNGKERISDIAWTTKDWVYDLVWPYMYEANKNSGWKYDIQAAEGMQITRYSKGGFYEFHMDGRSDNLSVYDKPENEFLHGRVRKLSMSIILNDNFEGGELEFASYRKGDCEVRSVDEKGGTVIVFPSFMEHRIAEVTKGTRYSLVVWFVGPPFK